MKGFGNGKLHLRKVGKSEANGDDGSWPEEIQRKASVRKERIK